MKTNSFNSGDEVRLKSGGPKMTVVVTSSNLVYCQWFNENNDLEQGTFAEHVLDLVKKAEPTSGTPAERPPGA